MLVTPLESEARRLDGSQPAQESPEELVDPNVVAALPNVAKTLEVAYHLESAWAKAFRLMVLHSDNSGEQQYFMKVSVGKHGRDALKGEFEATKAMYSVTPDICPEPMAWGTFLRDPNSHFYLCKFYNFVKGLPNSATFCEKVARLHLLSRQASPNGKFGFHCTTYNGNLPQDNSWCDSWEEFFSKGLRHMLKVREERAGPCPELDAMLPPLFEKVIPRLLRPLESHGRKVEPSMVHGDLWSGNAAIIDEDTIDGIIYDPSSFWAHNEYELGNWRPHRNGWSKRYFRAYHQHVPKSEPEEDYDDRNALYALRFNLQAAALFPTQGDFLVMVMDEIRQLTEKFPDGYTGQ